MRNSVSLKNIKQKIQQSAKITLEIYKKFVKIDEKFVKKREKLLKTKNSENRRKETKYRQNAKQSAKRKNRRIPICQNAEIRIKV